MKKMIEVSTKIMIFLSIYLERNKERKGSATY